MADMRERGPKLLRDCLIAAVQVAILRHQLLDEEGEIDEENRNAIALDSAAACFGEDSCAEEPVEEVAAMLNFLALPQAGPEVCSSCGRPVRSMGDGRRYIHAHGGNENCGAPQAGPVCPKCGSGGLMVQNATSVGQRGDLLATIKCWGKESCGQTFVVKFADFRQFFPAPPSPPARDAEALAIEISNAILEAHTGDGIVCSYSHARGVRAIRKILNKPASPGDTKGTEAK